MNKYTVIFLLFSLILGVGCQAEQTAVPILTITATTEPTPTKTAVPNSTITFTVTTTPQSTSTLTNTPFPTVTPEPFTQGHIIFWWHPVLIPSEPDQPYPKEPRSGLYEAIPGAFLGEWTVQPLLEDIGLFPQTFLSPDKTKLAILVNVESDRYHNGLPLIHIYTFADRSLTPLDNQDYLNKLSWLPDNQAVVYPQKSNIELARLNGSPPEQVTKNPPNPIEGEPYAYIMEIVGSPDGHLLALDIQSGTGLSEGRYMPDLRSISFFDVQQKAIISNIENSVIIGFDMRWSADSEWLVFTGDQNQGLSVLNVETMVVQQLVEPPTLAFSMWAPDKTQLAFASDGQISIWDAESQTVQEVTSKDYVSIPAWSPDGSLLAAIYQEAGESGIVIVNPATQSEEMLNNGVRGGQVIWSPDGEWLTGFLGGGLHVVNKNTGEVHLILDTVGFPAPSSIMWLP